MFRIIARKGWGIRYSWRETWIGFRSDFQMDGLEIGFLGVILFIANEVWFDAH